MSAQKKKISLDFGRISSAQVNQISSDTIGDIGPSKIDELVASINMPDAETIGNFGANASSTLADVIDELNATVQEAEESTRLTREGLEQLQKANQQLGNTVAAMQGRAQPSTWQRFKNAAKGLMS